MTFFGNNYNIHGRFRCFFDLLKEGLPIEYGKNSLRNKAPENSESNEHHNIPNRILRKVEGNPSIGKSVIQGTILETWAKNPGLIEPKFRTLFENGINDGKQPVTVICEIYSNHQEILPQNQAKLIRKNIQNIQSGFKIGMSANDISSFGELISKKIKNLESNEDVNNADLENDIKKIGVNGFVVLDLLNNDKQDLGVLLLDVLTSIKENRGDVFGGNIVLSRNGIECLKKLYPNLNPDSLTIDNLGEIFGSERIIRPSIENALSENFINSLEEKQRIGLDGKISENIIDQIIADPILLKKFIVSYNYRNSENGKALKIDINKLNNVNKKQLRIILKKELYINAYDVNLSQSEKDEIDTELEKQFKEAKKRREYWREGRYYALHNGKERSISNYDDASGSAIAVELNIGNRLLNNFHTDIKEIDKKDKRVLDYAWAMLYKENNKSLLSKIPRRPDLFRKFYEETGKFMDFKGETWEKIKKSLNNDEKDIKDLRSILSRFNEYIEKSQNHLQDYYSNKNRNRDAVNNNSAIGAVIDGIRDIFSNLGENNDVDGKKPKLHLDTESPIELTDDEKGLIINGKFNGEHVKIKYDLETGKVYMNTCIANRGDMIIFGEKNPKKEIGEIGDFRSMLEYYSITPRSLQNKPSKHRSKEERQQDRVNRIESRLVKFETILTSQIGEMKEKIGMETQINQVKNEVSTRFLRTLGIIDEFSNGVVQFEKGSDAYKVMQLINNSKNSGDIQALSDGMKILVKYAGMNWGDKKVDKTEEYMKLSTLAKAKNNALSDGGENLPYFWGKIKDINILKNGVGSVPETYKNGFASLILDKFTNGGTSPNWILDKSNIENFVSSITSGVGLAYQMYAGNIG